MYITINRNIYDLIFSGRNNKIYWNVIQKLLTGLPLLSNK